jgi:hypothetical protein
MTETPKIGSIWLHKNGNIYTVIAIANSASQFSTYPPTVVYIGGNGNVWARALDSWHRSMSLYSAHSMNEDEATQ